MTLTTSEVRVYQTGELYAGPTGTTLPSDTTTALNVAFKGLGYFNDDGVKENIERDTQDIPAWQAATNVRTVVTSAKFTWKGTLLQTNKTNIETIFGTTVTQTSAHGTYTINPGATAGRKAFVFESTDGSNIKRTSIAEGEIVEIGEIAYATGEATAYEVTLVAYTNPVVYDSALKT